MIGNRAKFRIQDLPSWYYYCQPLNVHTFILPGSITWKRRPEATTTFQSKHWRFIGGTRSTPIVYLSGNGHSTPGNCRHISCTLWIWLNRVVASIRWQDESINEDNGPANSLKTSGPTTIFVFRPNVPSRHLWIRNIHATRTPKRLKSAASASSAVTIWPLATLQNHQKTLRHSFFCLYATICLQTFLGTALSRVRFPPPKVICLESSPWT